MAGFKTDGGVASQDVSDVVVFCLKSSSGQEVKTYRVPVSQAAIFENSVRAEEPKLREEAGEKDPLKLIRISRCF